VETASTTLEIEDGTLEGREEEMEEEEKKKINIMELYYL
jgi:hypothetical protein